MYIWNVKKAAKCLKEGSITEKQKFQTLFLYIVIGFCAMLIGSFVKVIYMRKSGHELSYTFAAFSNSKGLIFPNVECFRLRL